MAPLIRFTLISLYLALAAPLPFPAPPSLRPWLLAAVPLGFLLVVALTSERVELDATGLRVGHPPWCAWLLRRGWQLPWSAVTGLIPVATSQGGRVFYVRSDAGAFLLPQRVARFEDFLQRFAAATGIDTTAIGRISPPWTYRLLGVLALALLLAEAAGLGFVRG
ncbi:MAG: hypothetical protein VKI81_09935 [Synechococcaceae cyanobacterium]|nr:hypothetical protein [Synechococcaceae cyanobacterium]